MDVTCEKCGSEYDFDEARIPQNGLPVKCSSCQHVFTVQPQSLGRIMGNDGGEWKVRQPSGNVFKFKELTTLQRWIVERKVSRQDEISKNNKSWKRLGDIAELATFFQVLESADQANAPPSPTNLPRAKGAAWEQSPQNIGWHHPPSGQWQMGGGSNESEDSGMGSDNFYDDALVLKNNNRIKWILITLLLVIGIGVGTTYYVQPLWFKKLMTGRINELAVNHIKIGYSELNRDDYASIARALDNFDKARELEKSYSLAFAGLAEAELARAEYLSENIRDISQSEKEEDKDEDSEKHKEIRQQKEQEMRTRTENAFHYAKRALELAPNDIASVRAMADYYRFKGADKQMKPLLEKAHAITTNDARIFYVLGSSVEKDIAAADRAIRYFDQALEINPQWQRLRYKLAHVHHQQGDSKKAMLYLDKILKDVPTHERAKALYAVINPPPPLSL